MKFNKNFFKELLGKLSVKKQSATPKKTSKAERKNERKAPILSTNFKLIGIMVAAIIVILGIVAISFSVANTYKKPITKFVSMVNKDNTNINKYLKTLLPDFYYDTYNKINKIMKSSTNTDASDNFINSSELISKLQEELDGRYGDNCKIKFVITDTEAMEEEHFDIVKEAYIDLYSDKFEYKLSEMAEYDKYDYEDISKELGISKKKAKSLCKYIKSFMLKFKEPKISDGYYITGTLIVSDAKGKTVYEKERLMIQLIKFNGDWTIDYLTLPAELKKVSDKIKETLFDYNLLH